MRGFLRHGRGPVRGHGDLCEHKWADEKEANTDVFGRADYPEWSDHIAEVDQPDNAPGESIQPPTADAPIALSASSILHAALNEVGNSTLTSVEGETGDDAFRPYFAVAG